MDTQPNYDALLQKVHSYLLSNYEPIFDASKADMHCTTQELWRQLQSIINNPDMLTIDMVAGWLNDAGFVFVDYGNMRLEWILKKTIPLLS